MRRRCPAPEAAGRNVSWSMVLGPDDTGRHVARRPLFRLSRGCGGGRAACPSILRRGGFRKIHATPPGGDIRPSRLFPPTHAVLRSPCPQDSGVGECRCPASLEKKIWKCGLSFLSLPMQRCRVLASTGQDSYFFTFFVFWKGRTGRHFRKIIEFMAKETIYLTAEGYKKLKDELDHMRSVERPRHFSGNRGGPRQGRPLGKCRV